MTETWEIQCYEGTALKWQDPKTVCLSEQEVVGLLRKLLCAHLSDDEIIDATTGSRADLLAVAPNGDGGLRTTADIICHYTARRL